MRLLPTALVVGAATAAVPPVQHILQEPGKVAEKASEAASSAKDDWTKPLQSFQNHLKSLTDDARELWDEAYTEFSSAIDNNPIFSLPKKHTRRPDAEWNHIVRGADVQGIWTTNADGEKEREIDGRLESYDLRVKKTDPSALGIDPGVKQYTGYLDDNENDKHLFYCKSARVLFLFMSD